MYKRQIILKQNKLLSVKKLLLTNNPPISDGFLLNANMREALMGLGKASLLKLVFWLCLVVLVEFPKDIDIRLPERQ